MNRVRWMVVAAAAAAILAVVLWRFGPWTAPPDADTVMASGTIDATEVAVSFRMPGILQTRPVDEGSVVRMGQVLADLDPREMAARVHRARAAEQAALARLKDLERGYRPEEIAEARAQVELARASRQFLEEEAARSEALFETGALSRQRRDKDATAAIVAREQHHAAQERLNCCRAAIARRPSTPRGPNSMKRRPLSKPPTWISRICRQKARWTAWSPALTRRQAKPWARDGRW